MRRPTRPSPSALVSVGGKLLFIVVLVTLTGPIAAPFFGYNLLAVRSGSMSPAIETGGLAVVREVGPVEAQSLQVGEIITFVRPGTQSDLVTHRVAAIESTPETRGPIYRTQGDANGTPDTWRVTPDLVRDKMLFSIDLAGYAYVFVSTWPVRVGAAFLILFLAWVPLSSGHREPESEGELEASAHA